ncbi:hypothetical protein DYB31_007122 [Aphanomyces astaci]|uniref:Apple domain-containing protein n=2 Tax=Aphanomyces astaci TaxID=112090 RepID=A0A397EGH5_APHAT|nr:hypothetical protein DYB31_007122 [Aphanomyces astaci]
MCVCYSPFHLAEYPLHGYESPDLLPAGMDADFKLMAQLGYTTVRTYYSNYYGYDIAPIAAKYGIRLYLGVYMTTESWYESQVTSAVNAAVNYPNTVQAILIGNENVAPYGTFTVEDIVTQMNFTRNRIFNQTNRTFPVDTCYLKSAVGTKVNLTGRRAASISATPISCSTFENDVDYSGNDIGATKQVSANLCCSDCQAVAGCQLFVWRDGTCWLKRAKGASVRVLGANAGFLPSSMSVESCGVVEPNTDYVGNDIASVAGATTSDCCLACQSERTCNAYSQSQGKCYLKSGRSTVSTVSGVTSARVNKCSTVEVGVDYVGNDLAIDAMLHVDLNDDLAEFIDVTFASGDNVVVVVVGQRDVANDARLQTTLAELPQQVLFRRQQSMVTIEEDVELHSINRPSLGSTSERDRRKQSMVQRNSVDDKTLDNKGLEDEEYYERIVTSISTQPLEHFMASLDDESAESVADSDVSSDVSYSPPKSTIMRGIGGAVTAGLAAWSAQAKTILHISDVHLNLTLDEMNYGFDSSPRLLESALSYARSVLHDPDLLLYTGDAVAHIDHNESVLAKTVQTGFSMVQEYFHVKNVTAILGNADFHDYEFYVTDPEKGGTNPTIGMVDAPWKQALSPSHFEAFDTRGYLWYQIEPKLVVISLNTVPYSVKHKPDTKYLDDPFNQFEWLRRTLVEVQTNGSYAYIVGHIPPIIDSYGGESQWELKYMLTYQAIVEAFPDIIKAQVRRSNLPSPS